MKKHAHHTPATRRAQLDGSMDPTISFMRLPDGTKVPWAVAIRVGPIAVVRPTATTATTTPEAATCSRVGPSDSR